jgi:hypothetical protein
VRTRKNEISESPFFLEFTIVNKVEKALVTILDHVFGPIRTVVAVTLEGVYHIPGQTDDHRLTLNVPVGMSELSHFGLLCFDMLARIVELRGKGSSRQKKHQNA